MLICDLVGISGLGSIIQTFEDLILGCLMWIVWLERNHHSFENMEKTLDELKVLYQHSLFEQSCCWGFTNCSSLSEFMFPLNYLFDFLLLCFVVCFICFLLFIIMNNLYFSFFLINNSSQVTYQKKNMPLLSNFFQVYFDTS